LLGAWGYFHDPPRPEKEGKVVMFRLNAVVAAFKDFEEFFGWLALSVFYLGNIGFTEFT
jgi:hypothetical protein